MNSHMRSRTLPTASSVSALSPRAFVDGISRPGSYSVIPLLGGKLLDFSFHFERMCSGYELLLQERPIQSLPYDLGRGSLRRTLLKKEAVEAIIESIPNAAGTIRSRFNTMKYLLLIFHT